MSASANTNVRIAQPTVWQAFEQGSSILWRKILKDDSLHRFGRNGQAQHGMDMFGYRDGDTGKIVGVQCKCKGVGEQATEKEFRTDLDKALAYSPKLTEYFFTTTAADDAPLATFAAKLTEEQRLKGRNIIVRFWGWGTLEQRISEHPDVALVFDPNHSPTAEIQTARHEEVVSHLSNLRTSVESLATSMGHLSTDATTGAVDSSESALDAEIDRYRDLMKGGQPKTALKLLETLLASLTAANSGHIWFRVKANIGHCHLKLGQQAEAIDFLEQAVAHAPNDPKALANAVLALTLKGSYEDAIAMAFATKLELTPENEVVAAYALQAAGLAGRADPLSLIPEPLRATDAVQKYHIHYLRSARKGEWMGLARAGRVEHPDDEFYRQAGAEADIEEIITGSFDRSRVLTAQERPILLAAAETLAALWGAARVQEAPGREDVVSNCVNAASAFAAAGELARAAELVREALEAAGDGDPDLVIRAAGVAVEADDKELADKVFDVLPEEGVGLLLRGQIAARYGNSGYLAQLHGRPALETVPESEKDVIKALSATAWIKEGAKSDPATAAMEIGKLVAANASSARASVLVAQTANELGLPQESRAAYTNAVEAAEREGHWASRTMVSDYALHKGDYSAAAALLYGHVDGTRDSDLLLKLATALAYEYPSRARGAGFFADLPSDIRTLPRYLFLEGILHYHRHDLTAAQGCFEAAHAKSPDQIQPLLLLAQVHLRQGHRTALPDVLKDVVPGNMIGSAAERMNLSHLLSMAGRADEALKLGYETFDANRNKAKVNLKWIGLSMANIEKLHAISDAPVGVDFWVKLISDDGLEESFLIVDGPGTPADHRYGSDHSLVAAALGHTSGDRFEGPDSLGRSRMWRVVEVSHKYLHAHRDVTEHFNTRFPEATGFWVIRTLGNDVAPIFDVLRQQGEQAARVLGTYAEGNLPIALIVELGGGHVVKFMESLRANGVDIETCDGNLPEREAALAMVDRHVGKGIVLDTLTLWAVAGLDATDVLKELFGEVYLPRSSVEAITELEDDQSGEFGSHAGTSYYHDGMFYFDEATPERLAAIERSIAVRKDAITNFCTIAAVSAPDDFDPALAAFLKKGAFDPGFVAKERGLLLVSEDKRFRAWAGGEKVESAWLQVVFMYAALSGVIKRERYADLSARLAALGHTPITCTGLMFDDLVQHASDDDRYLVRALARGLGVEKADMKSHIGVFEDAVRLLWTRAPATLRTQWATGAMIESMLRFREDQRPAMISYIAKLLSRYPGGAEYFNGWMNGHFIMASDRTLAGG